MKLITRNGVKRIIILVFLLAVFYCLFVRCCSVIEVPPYVVSKHSRTDFQPAKSGNGELLFDNGIPVLVLRGSPQDMGAQQGVLLKPQLGRIVDTYLSRFLSKENNNQVALKALEEMKPFMPDAYVAELESMAVAAGVLPDKLKLLHTIIDIPRMPFCSAIIAGPPSIKEPEIIFGRNLDFFSLGIADKYTLITVYHPADKKSFASVTWPGFAGVLTGVNEDGLVLAMLVSLDNAASANGIPSVMLLREVLENAADMDSAVQLIRNAKRSAPVNLAIADAGGNSAVIEFTQNQVAVRRPEKGLLYCTNWFVSGEMRVSKGDDRYETMRNLAEQAYGNIGVAETMNILKAVPMSMINLQSMVILPKGKILYLAAGSIPATKCEYVKIDIGKYITK
ncbi:MAG: hypothetical protein HZA48_03945 [Planctomycetes bacterium]|nr:hypothetical protein [Planctomycetota bacterium]